MAGPVVNAPIILEVGKTKKRNIRDMERGQGKIMADLQEAMVEVTATLGGDAEGKQLVPVVLVYRRKGKKRKRRGRRGGGFFPTFF